MKKCSFCGVLVQDDAVKCRYCAEWLVDDRANSTQAQQETQKNDQKNGPLWICANCGVVSVPSDKKCYQYGSQKHLISGEDYKEFNDNYKLQGVKGWLAFFVFVLMMTSLVNVYNIIEWYEIIVDLKQIYLKTLLQYKILKIASLMVASNFILLASNIGILVAIFAHAYFTRKLIIYTLIGQFIFEIVVSYYVVAQDILPQRGTFKMIGANFSGILRSIIWILYFIRSERVKNTFGI